LNSERKSFAAFAVTGALLLSSLPAMVAAPLASIVPAAAVLANASVAMAAPPPTSAITVTPSVVGFNPNVTTTVQVTGVVSATNASVLVGCSSACSPLAQTAPADGNGNFTTTVTLPAGTVPSVISVTAQVSNTVVASTTLTVQAPALVGPVPPTGQTGTAAVVTANNTVNGVAYTFSCSNAGCASQTVAGNGGTISVTLPITAPAPAIGQSTPVVISLSAGGATLASSTFTLAGPPPGPGITLATSSGVITNTGVPLETLVLTATTLPASTNTSIQFNGTAMGLLSGSLTTDANGSLFATVQVPSSARPLTNTIAIVSGGTTLVSTPFYVMTQTVSYAGQTGPGGTFVSNVTGANFSANSPISVTLAATGTTTAVATNTVAISTDAVGNFALPTGSLQVPTGQASGLYQIVATDGNGLQATSASSSAQPFTVTALVSTGNASLGLIVNNGVANACTPPSGASVSVVGNAYSDSGAVATNVVTDSILATASGAYNNGETVSFQLNGSQVTTVAANGTTASANIVLTTTEFSPGLYTVSALGTNSGTVATAVLYICPPTVSVSPSAVQVGTPITVTGGVFGAGEAVSGTTYMMTSTTPISLGAGAPGVTQVFTVPTSANGGYTASFTPTAFGVYKLAATGVETTTTAQTTDLLTTTVFTVTAGGLQGTTTAVYPSQTFVVSATSGFVPGENVYVQPAGGAPITTTANNSGGFVATVVAPPNTPVGTLPITVTSASRGIIPGGVTQAITVPTASLTASPPSLAAGGNTTLVGTGFIPNQGVALGIYFAGSNGVLVPAQAITATSAVTADATGAFTTTFAVNPTVQVLGGSYVISGTSVASFQNTATTPVTLTTLGTTGGGVSPSQATTIYFAEGYTGRFATNGKADFDETISVLNPDAFAKTVTFTYQIQGSSTPVVTSTTIGPNSDILRSVNSDVGNDKIVSAIVSSNGRIAAERIINRTASSGKLDGDSSLGVTAPGTTWVFAEGYTGISFQEYLTVQNPGATAASVNVTFLPASVPATTTRSVSFTVPANSRWTENIRSDYLPYSDKSVGMIVTSDQPIVAEREEYWGDGAGSGKAGMASTPGMTNPAKQYFFAYGSNPGATAGNAGPAQQTNDESYVTVVNPGVAGSSDATVLVSFFGANGAALGSKSITVSPQTRETVVVNNVIAPVSGPFYTVVSSDQPVFVERPQYIGGSPNSGAHPGISQQGSPAGVQSVLFPSLNTSSASGTAISVTVFLLNPGATAVTVNGTYFTPSGSTVSVAYTVAPGALVTVNVNADAGNLAVGPLGAQYTTSSGQFVAAAIANTLDQTSYIGSQGVANQ
jgi:hypothetical protein